MDYEKFKEQLIEGLKDFVEEDSEEVQTREKSMSEQNDEVSDMGKTNPNYINTNNTNLVKITNHSLK